MKATIIAAAAAALGGVSASNVHNVHRHAHELFQAEKRHNDSAETCVPGCTTIYSYVTGPGTLVPAPAPSTTSVKTTSAPYPTSTLAQPPAPTPIASTCPTPGTYTFPATTVTITETTTVCGATTTTLPYGTHTIGGVTTVVTTSTTVVCPYATVETTSGVVTSTIRTTTYVCPSAGTYTIAPVTSTITQTSSVCVVPTVISYPPGTYTAPGAVVTVTETDFVYYCPFTSSSYAALPTPTPSAVNYPASTPSTPANYPSGGGSSGGVPHSGNGPLAISYTPYTSGGECKDYPSVLADIQDIKNRQFTAVRVYSTDCSTLENVGAACEATGLQMILGIFISDNNCRADAPHISEQITAIANWGKWNLVIDIVVANEAMFNGFCSPDQLADLITAIKQVFGAAGYTGTYTTTDVVSAWIGSGDMTKLCSVIDHAAGNIHAYFNGGIAPNLAGAFVSGQLELIKQVCNKGGYVAECGWPSQGNTIGNLGQPGITEQAAAIDSIRAQMPGEVVFFSYSCDQWKAPGECGCEQYWCCKDHFGN